MLKQVQKLIGLLIAWVTLPLFLMLTNPETLSLPLLIVPFVLFAGLLYITAMLVVRSLFSEVNLSRRRAMATTFATLPTLLLLLASIGQLTIRDAAIVIGLLAVLMFYLRRLDFIKNI